MARIRTVKPDYWTDERVGECSVSARLLFIACWNFADDHGGLDRSSKQLKAQAFPYDAIDCEPLVQELMGAGLLVEYVVGDKKYLHIKGFRKHQKVEKPAKPRVPLYDESLNSRGIVGEDSPRSSGSSLGREGKGKEKKERSAPPALVFPLGLSMTAWDAWKSYRKGIGKPIRDVSLQAAMDELATFGADQEAVVKKSIASGWQGLFAPKDQANGTRNPNGQPRVSAVERVKRATEAWLSDGEEASGGGVVIDA